MSVGKGGALRGTQGKVHRKKKRTDFELAVLLDQIQWSKIEWEKSQLILMERRKQNLGVSGCRCTVKLLGVKER